MKEQYNDFPICINCKYFLAEKTGPLQIIQTCGLTTIDPVTGEFADRSNKVKLAALYRKESMPCGPSGKYFQPNDKKKAEPKMKPVKVEEVKESTAKVIKVDVPAVVEKFMELPKLDFEDAMTKQVVDTTLIDVEPTEPPKKRRRRSK